MAAGRVIYFIEDGQLVAVSPENPLPIAGDIGAGDIVLAPGDVQIGAVEIKDAAGANRAAVDGTGHLFVVDAALLAAVDGVEALLTAIDGHVDTLEANTDGIEALLTALGANTDGLEAALATLHADMNDGGVATTSDDIAVDATAGGVLLLAANADRKGFIVQNTGANAIRVSIGSNAVANHGIQLAAGASLAMSAPKCPTGVIKAIREGANSSTASRIEVV